MAITRDVVRGFFRSNRERGIDLGRDMLWGYFFIDERRKMLEKLRRTLVGKGYRYVDILDRDESAVLYLHVERVERHTAASLYQRCVECYAIARAHQIADFDGFDVGNVDGSVLTGP
jgi:hypothetical protein